MILLSQANPGQAIKNTKTVLEDFFGYSFEAAGPKRLDGAGGQGRTAKDPLFEVLHGDLRLRGQITH